MHIKKGEFDTQFKIILHIISQKWMPELCSFFFCSYACDILK